MWDKVAEWNDSAFLAGWDLWEPGDAAGDRTTHPIGVSTATFSAATLIGLNFG